jgi:hypothetical protein
VRMSAMLAGKMTPDQATMLHIAHQLSGGETWIDLQGGYPSGCRLTSGGGHKSIGGSSWMNSELDKNGKDAVVLDWFRPLEKPYGQCGGIMRKRLSPLEWSSRSPCMAGGLGFPFEVGGPSSGSVTDLGRSPFVITERIPQSPGLLAAPPPCSKERLAPQAWQVVYDLDKVLQGLPRS